MGRLLHLALRNRLSFNLWQLQIDCEAEKEERSLFKYYKANLLDWGVSALHLRGFVVKQLLFVSLNKAGQKLAPSKFVIHQIWYAKLFNVSIHTLILR